MTRDELGKLAFEAALNSGIVKWDDCHPCFQEQYKVMAEAVREAVILNGTSIAIVVTQEQLDAVRKELRESGGRKTLADLKSIEGGAVFRLSVS